jgi:DNA replication protein DnaC
MGHPMQIKEIATELKLPYIKNNYQNLINQANQTSMAYDEFLLGILENEYELRKSNSVARRLRNARFPMKKYLEDFDQSKYIVEIRNKFKDIETLQFIDNKENIILIGSSGAGKTHYSIGLGIKACLNGKSVLFKSVPNLIIELKEAMSMSQLTSYKRKFATYDLVVLDELGYVSFDKAGCEILFNLLSERNDKGSIIITTNLNFDRWEEIFKDAMLTGAMVDRLAHKAHIIELARENSHRFEETIEWLKAKQ